MTTLGTMQAEMIFATPEGGPPVAILPPESYEAVEKERARLGVDTMWDYDVDPRNGERRPAIRPLGEDHARKLQDAGLQPTDRFMGTVEFRELTHGEDPERQILLAEVEPLAHQ